MRVLGPVHTVKHSFHFAPHCSEKWSAERLRSNGNASSRTFLYQKMKRLKSDTKSGTVRNAPFRSEKANGQYVNGTIAFPCELGLNSLTPGVSRLHINTLIRYTIRFWLFLVLLVFNPLSGKVLVLLDDR